LGIEIVPRIASRRLTLHYSTTQFSISPIICISEECCFGKGCFLPCSSWKAAAGIDKLVCGFQGGCHSEELWWSMRADEAVVQLPGSILPGPHPVAGLGMLLRSSQLFRTLSHSHMQGKSTVWSLDLMSLCFCYSHMYRSSGFEVSKSLYFVYTGLCRWG